MKQTSIDTDLEVLYPAGIKNEAKQQTSLKRALILRLRLLWANRLFLLKVSVIGLAAATLLAFLLPKRYEASTLLMPPDDESSKTMAMAAALGGRLSGSLSSVAGDVLGIKNSGDLFIGILRSRTIQNALVEQFNLKEVYSVRKMDAARRKLAQNSMIVQDHKTGIIYIGVVDRSPDRAARLAQAYVTELNKVVSQLSTSSARRERDFLEGRLVEVKSDLESAEKEFSDFSSKNTALDIKEQGRAMVDSAARLQGQMMAAQSELEGLKQVYAETNVRVRSLRARIAELNAQLQKLGGQTGNGLAESQDGSMYPTIRKLPLLGVPYEDLYRKMKVQEAVFETLTQEYELSKVAEAKETPSVKVLDPAELPEEKMFPPRLLIMCTGLLMALLAGGIWVLGKAGWEKISADDPAKILAQDVFRGVSSYIPVGDRHRLSTKMWAKLFRKNSVREATVPEPESPAVNL